MPGCSTRKKDGVGIVDVNTNLGAAAVDAFRSCVDEMLNSDARKLLINFGECQYICSSGIGVIADVLRNNPGRKDHVALSNVKGKLHVIMERVQFTDLIRTFENEETAIEALTGNK